MSVATNNKSTIRTRTAAEPYSQSTPEAILLLGSDNIEI